MNGGVAALFGETFRTALGNKCARQVRDGRLCDCGVMQMVKIETRLGWVGQRFLPEPELPVIMMMMMMMMMMIC
jgi:hypothetical protein